MDSITYDFRQASPEDSLNHHQHTGGDKQLKAKQKYREDTYYDSLGDFSKPDQVSMSYNFLFLRK